MMHLSHSLRKILSEDVMPFCCSAWIESANVKPYFQYKNRLMNANKTTPFKDAVGAIEKYISENNIAVSCRDALFVGQCGAEKVT